MTRAEVRRSRLNAHSTRRGFWVLLIAALFILGVNACGSGSGDNAASSTAPIRLGVVAPLSGPTAAAGPVEVNGAKLAVEQYNAEGGYNGRKVELIINDDRSDPQTGLAVTQKLIRSNHVVGIVGSGFSGSALASKPAVQQGETAYVTVSSADTITDPPPNGGKNYMFRSAFSASAQVEAILRYADTLPDAKIGIVYENSGFGIPSEKSTRDVASKLGTSEKIVDSVSVATDATRLEAPLERLRRKGVNTIIDWQAPAGMINLVKSLRTLGWEPDTLSGYSATNRGFIKTAGAPANGLLVANAYSSAKNPRAKEFEKSYEAKFGENPWPIFSALYYDTTRLLLQAVDKAGPDPKKIRDALETTTGFEAATAMPAAPYSSSNHTAIQPDQVFISEIRDGELVTPSD